MDHFSGELKKTQMQWLGGISSVNLEQKTYTAKQLLHISGPIGQYLNKWFFKSEYDH